MKAPKPPSGALWLQHDNFRVIARKDGPRVKLYSGRARPIVETRIISG
jgi:hypothetical protein